MTMCLQLIQVYKTTGYFVPKFDHVGDSSLDPLSLRVEIFRPGTNIEALVMVCKSQSILLVQCWKL